MNQVHQHFDQVTLVDKNDKVLGAMDKLEAHRNGGVLHRAISVFLFRKKNDKVELLIQQRSAKKIVGAGQWANTACGNVRPTENYLECAQRRLREELGIIDPELVLQPGAKFQYQVACNPEFSENELDQVFVGWYDGEVRQNPEEVANTDWVLWQKLQDGKFEQLDYDWAPWFEIMLKRKEVVCSIFEVVYGK
ncbi:MAG: NUDIX domain-containing protein [bacterium]|nr:NUDIX domain-containing protein [bacterium]